MVTDFSINTEFKNGCLILSTKGYLNNNGGEKMLHEYLEQAKKGVNSVIVNLAETNVVNSIGISFLIEIIEKVNEAEGQLYFTNVDPAIEKTFDIMGIFQFAQKAASVEEALGTAG